MGPEPGTLVEVADDTTNDYVELFSHTRATGLFGIGTIQNNDGGADDMTVKQTATDFYATTDSTESVVAAGDDLPLSCQENIGTARPPYETYTVEVKSTVEDASAPYDCKFSSNQLGTATPSELDFAFFFSGLLSTGQNDLIPMIVRRFSTVVDRLDVYLQIAPTGDDVVIDFLDDGVSIGTVTVAAGDTTGTNALGAPVTIDADSVVTMEITQVGSNFQGQTATGYIRATV